MLVAWTLRAVTSRSGLRICTVCAMDWGYSSGDAVTPPKAK